MLILFLLKKSIITLSISSRHFNSPNIRPISHISFYLTAINITHQIASLLNSIIINKIKSTDHIVNLTHTWFQNTFKRPMITPHDSNRNRRIPTIRPPNVVERTDDTSGLYTFVQKFVILDEDSTMYFPIRT